ncbi:MAG: hypothetical protein V1694_03985 [Candidatus Eisenbacteria bacterium]
MRILIMLMGVVVVLYAGIALGHTICIRPDGTGDVTTIRAGMDSAGVGDTLLLASGTFTGAGNHDLIVPGKSLVIRSEAGNSADCTIDCEGQYGFQFWTDRTVVDGLTISNAGSSAVRIHYDRYREPAPPHTPDVTFTNCVFASNSGFQGGAVKIDCSVGLVLIKNCEFVSNYAEYEGGAVYVYGIGGSLDLTIKNCIFRDNSTQNWGGAISCSRHEVWVAIVSSIFYHNSAGSGGGLSAGIVYGGVQSCTFIANYAAEGSGIAAGENMRYFNCIMAYGTGGYSVSYQPSEYYPYPDIRCTDIYGNEGGDWVGPIADLLGQDGNFSECPGFCNSEMEPYDLRLCSTSPCLPGNNPTGYNCPLVGALGEGCVCGPSETHATTWGAIKAMYK